MRGLILSLDQGTSGTKACVFEPPGRLIGSATVPVERSSPEPDAVEQDPLELVQSCREAAEAAVRSAGIAADDLAGCALANTGESFLLFEGPGRPATQVIGWQDSRAGTVLEGLEQARKGDRVRDLTGLPMHAEFTAPKLAHWLDRLGSADGLRFGTLDTWIVACLDPRAPHVTDRATASRTMLVSLEEADWSQELLDAFGVPRELLPAIEQCDSMGASLDLCGTELPLLASGYDMGLALLGHACLGAGQTKATFGTCLGVMAATSAPRRDVDGLLTTIAYTSGGKSAFGLDGEIAAAGALIAWAVSIGIAGSPAELLDLAASVPSAEGAVLVPALTGLGAPQWRDDVEGRIVGLTPRVGRAQLARAVADAIAFTLADVLDALRAGRIEVEELRVDGGLSRHDGLMQLCADVCGIPIVRSGQEEATAFGAAALAMLAAGTATEEDLQAVALEGAQAIEPGRAVSDAERAAWREALESALA
jgi:glycerol kinase